MTTQNDQQVVTPQYAIELHTKLAEYAFLISFLGPKTIGELEELRKRIKDLRDQGITELSQMKKVLEEQEKNSK